MNSWGSLTFPPLLAASPLSHLQLRSNPNSMACKLPAGRELCYKWGSRDEVRPLEALSLSCPKGALQSSLCSSNGPWAILTSREHAASGRLFPSADVWTRWQVPLAQAPYLLTLSLPGHVDSLLQRGEAARIYLSGS